MMLEGYAHQVAGHKEEALLGIANRLVLKPLVKKDLFARESTFYSRSADAKHDTNSVLRYTAGFFGILYCNSCRDPSTLSPAAQEERAKNNSLLPHIVLEDLTFGYSTPNVIDIKMGTCTFEPTATQKKKDREQLKYPYQSELGFRVTGFKVYDADCSTYIQTGKPFGRSIVPAEVVPALALLFRSGGTLFRSDVIKSVIAQLECLLLWMRSQTRYKFYCTSLLIVYDAHTTSAACKVQHPVDEHKGDSIGSSTDIASAGGGAGELTRSLCSASNNQQVLRNIDEFLQSCPAEPPLVRVKMIDFAHVIESQGDDNAPVTLDEGYIHGLTMLIRSLHTLLEHIEAEALLAGTQDVGQCGLRAGIAKLLERMNTAVA